MTAERDATVAVVGAGDYIGAAIQLYRQPRDAWTFELEIRPFAEKW